MKYSKTRTLVDEQTGEIYTITGMERLDTDNGSPTYCFQCKKDGEFVPNTVHRGTENGTHGNQSKKRVSWMKLNMKAECAKLASANLSGRDHKVLAALRSLAGWGSIASCTHQDLADLSGVARPHVSASIKRLAIEDLAIKIDAKRYRLNPSIYWVGSDEDHKGAVAQYYRQKERILEAERKAAAAKRDERRSRLRIVK